MGIFVLKLECMNWRTENFIQVVFEWRAEGKQNSIVRVRGGATLQPRFLAVCILVWRSHRCMSPAVRMLRGFECTSLWTADADVSRVTSKRGAATSSLSIITRDSASKRDSDRKRKRHQCPFSFFAPLSLTLARCFHFFSQLARRGTRVSGKWEDRGLRRRLQIPRWVFQN